MTSAATRRRDRRIEYETAAAREIAACLDRVCPNVFGNPFIPHTPFPAQAVALGLYQKHQAHNPQEVHELLYGGAAAGGKSDWLLMAAAQFVHVPGYAGVLVRRTYKQLMHPSALLHRAHRWWNRSTGVHWNGTDMIFTFPSGAQIKFAYHATPRDDDNFQGAEYQFAGFDELTQWPDSSAYDWVAYSRMRRLEGVQIPLRGYCTANPGGVGHDWVKKKHVGGTDDVGALIEPTADYLPARLLDNPYVDRPTYMRSLMKMHPTRRDQLLNGDWSARDPGDYFRREWFGELLDPIEDAWPVRDKLTVRWWDLAASKADDACFTSGVKMSRHRMGVRAIEHHVAFRETPGRRDDLIVQQAQADGHHVIVGIEIEPGSGGVAQFETLRRRLRDKGFRVVGRRPSKVGLSDREQDLMLAASTSSNAKALRCEPVSSCLQRGHQRRGECDLVPRGEWWGVDMGKHHTTHRDGLLLYAGPWTSNFLSAVEGFPGSGRMDDADATSGAFAYLEAHPFGRAVPADRLATSDELTTPELASMHPSQRPRPLAGAGAGGSASGVDRRGRFTP